MNRSGSLGHSHLLRLQWTLNLSCCHVASSRDDASTVINIVGLFLSSHTTVINTVGLFLSSHTTVINTVGLFLSSHATATWWAAICSFLWVFVREREHPFKKKTFYDGLLLIKCINSCPLGQSKISTTFSHHKTSRSHRQTGPRMRGQFDRVSLPWGASSTGYNRHGGLGVGAGGRELGSSRTGSGGISTQWFTEHQ